MPGTLTTYKIFIASAGGLEDFRTGFRNIIEHYNATEAYHRGYMFMPIGWEDTTTGHGRPQAKINEDLRQCDFALFMFRNRWGTPPAVGSTYTSGTEEEWAIANEMHATRAMRDIQGCFFPFKSCDTQEEMDHRKKVETFKQRLIGEKQFFFKSFGADGEFNDWLRSIVSGWLREIEKDARSLAESRKQFIAPEKLQANDASALSKSTFNLVREQLSKLLESNQYRAAEGVVQVLHQLAEKPMQHALVLQFDGFIQSQLGQFHEALQPLNELVRRFGDTTDPVLREQVAMALFHRSLTLSQLNQSEAAIATCDEVVRRFGDATEPALRTQVAKALFNKGITQGQLNQSEAEIATYNEVVRRFGDAAELALREVVTKALVNKGLTQSQLNQSEEAIATYEKVVRRVGDATELALREAVTKALVNKGITQDQLNQSEEAIATYEEVVRHFGDATEPALREQVTKALVNKCIVQCRLKLSEAAIATCDEVVRRVGDASEPIQHEQIAKVLVCKGVAEGQLNQGEAEIGTYDEVVCRIGDAAEPELRGQVALALFNKGVAQGRLNQSEAAIATYDEVVRRFGDADEPAVRELVAKALSNKGVDQGRLNQSEAAIATYDEVVRRFGDASEPTLRELVAKALVNKGITQSQLSQIDAATTTYDEVVRRFGDATEPALRENVNSALNGSGFGRLLQAKRFGPQTPPGQDCLRTAMENLNDVIARSTQPHGMYLGNRAYVHYLLGQPVQAEADFSAALRAPEYGGRTIYEATLKDLDLHPIPEDQGMRELVERAWAKYNQEVGDGASKDSGQ